MKKDIWELLMYLNILDNNNFIDLYTPGAAVVLLAQKKINYQINPQQAQQNIQKKTAKYHKSLSPQW